jgi:hypothetical protein
MEADSQQGSLLDTSESVDGDHWEHGHLLLVAVKKPEI